MFESPATISKVRSADPEPRQVQEVPQVQGRPGRPGQVRQGRMVLLVEFV